MHVVLNAIPTHVGGGLSVTLVLADAVLTHLPDARLTVLTSREPVDAAVREAIAGRPRANAIRMAAKLGSLRSFAWQNRRLGAELRRAGADVLVGFNHLVERVDCRQIIYHINLRRFSRDYRSKNPLAMAGEAIRDRAAGRALRLADANVFESEYLWRRAEQRHPGISIQSPSVVYNGLPEETFAAAAPKPPSSLSTPDGPQARLLTLTNPNPHKDCGTMVRTLAELVRRRPDVDWLLDVAGGHDPSVWDGVRDDARDAGVLDRIEFVGFCDGPRIAELTRRSLCVISTSRMESFQLVGVEGMARGCPCVVADCASMPESVGPAGLLAQPGNAGDFADRVTSLLDPTKRAARVESGLSWTTQFHRDACGRRFTEVIAGQSRAPEVSRAA